MSEKGIQSLPADVTRQLQVLTRSQWFIMVTVCAILLSYYSVSLMKQKLVCTATDPALCKCLPETLPIQTFSSILILLALTFYVGLSGKTVCQAKQQGNPKQIHTSSVNHTANLLVLITGMIRFGLLIAQDRAESSLWRRDDPENPAHTKR